MKNKGEKQKPLTYPVFKEMAMKCGISTQWNPTVPLQQLIRRKFPLMHMEVCSPPGIEWAKLEKVQYESCDPILVWQMHLCAHICTEKSKKIHQNVNIYFL